MFRRKKTTLPPNVERMWYERRAIKGSALASEGSPGKSV